VAAVETVGAASATGGDTAREVPHSAQNLVAVAGAPQPGQARARGVPHSAQNLAPEAEAVPHATHVIPGSMPPSGARRGAIGPDEKPRSDDLAGARPGVGSGRVPVAPPDPLASRDDDLAAERAYLADARADLSAMRPGSVIVDVAIDQGGCVETIHATTHENPTYVVDGVIHYGVANMPGGVPRTSTLALTNATLPYALQLANKGWQRALKESPALLKGLNVAAGKVTYAGVAEAFGMELHDAAKCLV